MFTRTRIAVACFSAAFGLAAFASKPAASAPKENSRMTQHAKGSFEVKVLPQTDSPEVTVASIGRFALDKRYHGDLDAQSHGQMLGSRSNETTGGYVAIEQVEGTLAGHKGSFALQHIGTMQGGNAVMDVRVIPGSGTGELAGIDGTLKISIADGKHAYDFNYTLP